MDCYKIVEKIKSSVAFVIGLDIQRKTTHQGSGFIFSKTGILITCNHLIKDASDIKIKFPDSDFITAKIALKDEEHDLALLKFVDKARKPIEAGDYKKVKVGMPVIFSGYPLGLTELTTHQGILSAIIKDPIGVITYLIDGTVNLGNSGCPLMDFTGGVIGVINAKRRERNILLGKVEKMRLGAISLYDVDLIEIFQAILENVQLGIGYAVPAAYIPQHKEIEENLPVTRPKPQNENNKKEKKI